MGYWTDRLNKKRAKESQERRIGHAKSARQDAIDQAAYWFEEGMRAREIKQWDYSTECFQMAAAMNDARAGATHEILQRRKAMGY